MKPFYVATMFLQQQTFHSLALSKVITNSLIVDFEKRASTSNKINNDRLLSQVLLDKLNSYLYEKPSEDQKRATLVRIFDLFLKNRVANDA